MMAGQDRQGVGADLVGCVPIGCHPVSPHHNGVHPALCHQGRRSRVTDQGGRQLVMHQLKRRQPGTCMCITGVGSGREACRGTSVLLPILGSMVSTGWGALSLHTHKGLLGHERIRMFCYFAQMAGR